jgi:hypothetical protein
MKTLNLQAPLQDQVPAHRRNLVLVNSLEREAQALALLLMLLPPSSIVMHNSLWISRKKWAVHAAQALKPTPHYEVKALTTN